VAWAASAMAAQNQAIWVSDNGGGISLTPATSTNGTVLYTGSDAFWSSVIVVGVAYPPNSGLATLGSPAINVSISALSDRHVQCGWFRSHVWDVCGHVERPHDFWPRPVPNF
jgi:hypothetical protein